MFGHELAVARSWLESEGVECYVKDELTVQVNPFYSNAIGGVKLQVREEDAERAIQLLKEGGFLEEPNENVEKEIIATINADANICPYCGSAELSKPRLSKKAFVFSLILLGFPIPFMGRTRHCFNCSRDFKQNLIR